MFLKKFSLPVMIILVIGLFFSFKMIAYKANQSQYDNMGEIHIAPVEFNGENVTKNQVLQQTIMQVINGAHYSPKDINDDFSKKVFDKYLEMSDYGKLFFVKNDIEAFKKYQYQLDDEFKAGTTQCFELVNNTWKERMKEAESYYIEALNKPFDFTIEDEIELDGKKLDWCLQQEELKARWYRSMKYRTLARITELKEQREKAIENKKKNPKDTTTIKTDEQIDVEARENVKKNLASYFKRLGKIKDEDRFATYMNSYCHVVDPHTDFFPPKDKQRFDEEMSGKFFGIGAVLQSEDGVCKIKQIVVGSPCWKDGRLRVGDIINKVAQQNEDPVDITGWDIEDVVSIIRGKENSLVLLSVKHLDGTEEVITIVRGKVEKEETFAKSVIIKQGNANIGYIMLPEFYADFENPIDGRRCATDMEKEIKKLKDEKVQGIIIDLRNNGGGSLTDVVEIAGMFIDKGPVVQVKSKEQSAQTLVDRSAGAIYDGPLAILVNQGSASASEILAAAMQDYGRGIIIGTTTFGKGTVQRVFPLESFYQENKDFYPLGSIKLTLQKFYRINGGSTQLKGVKPDLVLPDLYELIDIGERKDSNSLSWDQIAKADYKPIKQNVDFGILIENAKKRITQDERFNLIQKNAQRLKKQSEDNRYFLQEKKYMEQMRESKDIAKKLEALEDTKKFLNIVNVKVDMPIIQKDTANVTKNNEWIKLMKKDPYIMEASNVINDWIKLAKAPTMGSVINNSDNK